MRHRRRYALREEVAMEIEVETAPPEIAALFERARNIHDYYRDELLSVVTYKRLHRHPHHQDEEK